MTWVFIRPWNGWPSIFPGIIRCRLNSWPLARPEDFSEEVKLVTFRSARELLMNALKHARATRVVLEIQAFSDRLKLTVTDNGVGFEQSANLRQKGFGLFSIRDRLDLMGGHLEIRTGPGQGTKIILLIPRKGHPDQKGSGR